MKRKGLTLIEVILAIALLGIIAIGFISAFSNYFSWMIFTKDNITIDAFDAQKSMERRITDLKTKLEIKEDIYQGEDFNYLKNDIFIFSSYFPESSFKIRNNSKAYIIEENLGGSNKFTTMVGDSRLQPLPIPIVARPAQVFVRNISNISEPYENLLGGYDKFEYYNFNNLRMYGLSKLEDNPQGSFYKNKHEWYISEPGFIMPTPPVNEIDIDNDLGKLYPSFPDNYKPIPIFSPEIDSFLYSNLSNSIINQIDYIGKHIIYEITPYSKELKKGISGASFPLYLMGPYNTSNLDIHLDASTIMLGDTESIDEDYELGYKVKLLKNLRPTPSTKNKFNATQTEPESKPVLVSDILYGDESYISPAVPFQGEGTENKSIWGRAIGNKPTTDPNDISSLKIDNYIMGNNSYNIFLVMRKVDYPFGPLAGGKPIIKGISNSNPWSLEWEINTEDEETRSILLLRSGLEDSSAEFTNNYTFNSGEWNLVNIQFEYKKISYSTYNLTNGKEEIKKIVSESEKISSVEIFTNGLELNLNGIQLAEVLMYKNINNEEINNTVDFLRNKYNNNIKNK